ncbi:MAG: thermonuclease family protein, partial [Candidatus Thiodiazotropha sp.]
LEFNIGSNFVDCDIKDKTTDGNLVGLCYANNRDLAAQLLLQGWAVARPEASIEYHTLEKMARNRGVGIWGIPIDRLR